MTFAAKQVEKLISPAADGMTEPRPALHWEDFVGIEPRPRLEPWGKVEHDYVGKIQEETGAGAYTAPVTGTTGHHIHQPSDITGWSGTKTSLLDMDYSTTTHQLRKRVATEAWIGGVLAAWTSEWVVVTTAEPCA